MFASKPRFSEADKIQKEWGNFIGCGGDFGFEKSLLEYFKRNRNGGSKSVFDVYSSKGNPLFQRVMEMVCKTEKFESRFVEIDVDHKVMGNFNPCRFEML